MNYKGLFHIALQLISSPARAWEEIRLEEDRRKVLTEFVYPMIGLCGLLVLVTTLVRMDWGEPQSYQVAMTRCSSVAVSFFGGFFLAAYSINWLNINQLKRTSNMPLAQQFAGYAMVVPFLLRMVIALLPDFTIIALLLMFYIVYVVWEGSDRLMKVEEKDRFRFTILSSLLLILCPLAIEWIFDKLTVALN
ncbi:MAG: YIP1 family protein [Bacteroides sp.]|nr:YIP1 family protein [Bacteroides sp.]